MGTEHGYAALACGSGRGRGVLAEAAPAAVARRTEEGTALRLQRHLPELVVHAAAGYHAARDVGRLHEVVGDVGLGSPDRRGCREPRTPEPMPVKTEPAVPIRRSIHRDRRTCLVCGKRRKTLRRRLGVAHGPTPSAYREMFGLKPDHPMVAPGCGEERAELARKIGRGGLRKKATSHRRRQTPNAR
jgi:predicted transcriptional regulator